MLRTSSKDQTARLTMSDKIHLTEVGQDEGQDGTGMRLDSTRDRMELASTMDRMGQV